MKKHSLAASMLGLALGMSAMTDLGAAELKVLAGGSTSGWMNQLGPQFEHASGHKLVIHFDSTPHLIRQATSGAPFDLAVVPVDVFKDAGAKARFALKDPLSKTRKELWQGILAGNFPLQPSPVTVS